MAVTFEVFILYFMFAEKKRKITLHWLKFIIFPVLRGSVANEFHAQRDAFSHFSVNENQWYESERGLGSSARIL